MFIKKEINNFEEIAEMVWSGAVDTIDSIVEADKEDEFMDLLENIFWDEDNMPTETELNDYIWFETDFIFENLGLDENGEIPHEEPEESELEKREESIIEMKSTDDFDVFCNDCDTCILDFCKSQSECKEMFENYWNQTLDMEDIVNEWE